MHRSQSPFQPTFKPSFLDATNTFYQYFYGYKDQVSLNVESELVTSVIPGDANDYDGHKLKELVEKDLSKGIEIETLVGDRGYDDGENHYELKQKGIK